jgi:hypothetical protein
MNLPTCVSQVHRRDPVVSGPTSTPLHDQSQHLEDMLITANLNFCPTLLHFFHTKFLLGDNLPALDRIIHWSAAVTYAGTSHPHISILQGAMQADLLTLYVARQHWKFLKMCQAQFIKHPKCGSNNGPTQSHGPLSQVHLDDEAGTKLGSQAYSCENY